MPGQLLIDEPADGVLRLTLSNPAKRNALDHPLLDAIAHAVASAPGRGARAILLTGEEGMFSSGYDIGDISDDDFTERARTLGEATASVHTMLAAVLPSQHISRMADAFAAKILPTTKSMPERSGRVTR